MRIISRVQVILPRSLRTDGIAVVSRRDIEVNVPRTCFAGCGNGETALDGEVLDYGRCTCIGIFATSQRGNKNLGNQLSRHMARRWTGKGRYRDSANGRDFSGKCYKVIAILCKVHSRGGLLIVVPELNGHIDGIVGHFCLCLIDQAILITAISEALGCGSIVSVVAT